MADILPNLEGDAGRHHEATPVIIVGSDGEVSAFGTDYETVAASAADQVLGTAGAAGDLLSGLTIIPASTSPAAVSIKDGAGSAITVFAGGASSVADLKPIHVLIGAKSAAGAWSVTTGLAVSVIATGKFS